MAIKAAPRVRSDAVPLRTFRSTGRPVAIAGLGVHAPEKVLTNQDLEKMVDTSDQWITERTGIKRRHVAEPGTTTYSLATEAARKSLAASAVRPGELDMIIVATSSPDGPFPSVACRVQNELGVAGACALDLLAACTGFVYALSAAETYVSSGRAEAVLVIGAEVRRRRCCDRPSAAPASGPGAWAPTAAASTRSPAATSPWAPSPRAKPNPTSG
jgi:3-oxoacyl-(acyl-carrier-protein) synthase III